MVIKNDSEVKIIQGIVSDDGTLIDESLFQDSSTNRHNHFTNVFINRIG